SSPTSSRFICRAPCQVGSAGARGGALVEIVGAGVGTGGRGRSSAGGGALFAALARALGVDVGRGGGGAWSTGTSADAGGASAAGSSSVALRRSPTTMPAPLITATSSATPRRRTKRALENIPLEPAHASASAAQDNGGVARRRAPPGSSSRGQCSRQRTSASANSESCALIVHARRW